MDTFELIQSIKDDPYHNYKCENCKKTTEVKRLIVGGSGMIIKGSGFYLTDYTNYGKTDQKEKSVEKKKNEKE